MRRGFAATLVLFFLLPAYAVHAQQAGQPMTRVALASGDMLTGRLVEQTDDAVILDHEILGRLTIPANGVESVTTVLPGAERLEQPPR